MFLAYSFIRWLRTDVVYLRSWSMDISRRQICDIMNSYERKMYQSGFNQRNRSSRRYILRDWLHNIGIWDCEGCLNKSEILGLSGRAGWPLRPKLKPQSTGRLSSSRKQDSSSKVYQLIELGPPWLSENNLP